MDRALLDSCTFFDIRKAPKHLDSEWAQNSLGNLIQYQSEYPSLTVSAFTIFECLEGFYRKGRNAEAEAFLTQIVPTLEVIYPDQAVHVMAAKIHASLARVGKGIGVADTFIAASAVVSRCVLVTANESDFARLNDVGFSLEIQNWRIS